MLNTKFWDDSYIVDLSPEEKLFYLYLLLNPLNSIAGIFEITIKRMQFDTGLTIEFLEKTIKKFEKDDKIIYKKNWMFLKNFIKNQSLNPKIKEGIRSIFKLVDGVIDGISVNYDNFCINFNNDIKQKSEIKKANINIVNINEKKSCEEIIKFWNKKNIKKCIKITPELINEFNKITKEMSMDQIKKSINIYGEVINNEKSWFKYRWNLFDFLSKKNGCRKWCDNDPINFINKQKKDDQYTTITV